MTWTHAKRKILNLSTLADHMPAEGSLTMLDQVMFFCVSLILSAGIETWVLDTLHNHWIFDDDLVEKINFYTAIAFCLLSLLSEI